MSTGSGGTLSVEELTAARLVAEGFRGGAPLRAVLDATESLHGTVAWERAIAQRHLLAETVHWSPDRGAGGSAEVPGFTFGTRRCARFCRLLLDEVERARAVPDELLVTLAARAVGARAPPGEIPHLCVRAPDGCDVILRAGSGASGSGADIGLRLWEAGAFVFLALRSPPLAGDITNRAVLELGSGLGLTVRALVDAGASRAVLTDASQVVLDALRTNVRRVADEAPPPRTELRVARLNVCDASAVARLASAHGIETIIAADLTYDGALVRDAHHIETMRPDRLCYVGDGGGACDGVRNMRRGQRRAKSCRLHLRHKKDRGDGSCIAGSIGSNCPQCRGATTRGEQVRTGCIERRRLAGLLSRLGLLQGTSTTPYLSPGTPHCKMRTVPHAIGLLATQYYPIRANATVDCPDHLKLFRS